MDKKFDFAGWATRANMLCSDGRIIRKNAFEHCDGVTVPLFWNHQHNRPEEVLGHALLEAREDGVYAYGSFNDTHAGQNAKMLVQHGDITQLSIFANKLKQQGCNVIHGMIREVSLVMAGANPGAYIESVMMHGDDSFEEGEIFTGEDFEYVKTMFHADESEKGDEEVAEETKKKVTEDEETVADVFDTLSEKQKKAVYAVIGQAIEDATKESSKEEAKHSDEDSEDDAIQHDAEDSEDEAEEVEDEDLEHADETEDGEETVEDVFNTLNEKQKKAVYFMIAQALEDKETGKEDEGGNANMKHNVFENETMDNTEVLSHAEIQEIFADAKSCGSLKEAVLAHGIEDIDILFPDAKTLNNEPGFIKRNDDWVAKVLGGVHHAPFARIKTVFADITADQARAKGYQKGKLKLEEVFKLLKRVTGPTTVYKKQKLDRDDVLDIDFNVIPWMKGEMRMMLDEELARAFLVGDGRNPVDEADDKIDEECIRPIWKMEELFTVKVKVDVAAGATAEDRAKAFVKAAVKSRKNYEGSGNPSMFMSEDMLTDCLLIEDGMGRPLYETEAKLAAALRVREIIPVPVMEGLTRTEDGTTFELGGIYVNLKDYSVGTNKGGEISMFDDFDIDYNAMKYLMETRCSGTLTKPRSAVAIEFVEANA